MPKMKNSGVEWIGDIPENWEIMRIKNLFELRNEKNYLPLNEVNLISLYTDKGVIQHSDVIETTGNKAVNADGYKKVYEKDIVVNIILCWMGAVGMSKYNGVTSPAYDVYKPKHEVCSEYYHYLFRTNRFNGECYRYGRGIMMMRWRTYSQEFSSINIPVPPLETQNAIVSAIESKTTKIDSLISNEEKQIEKLKAYKQALITETVTKGLDKTVEMKNSGVEWLGEIPEGWECKKLKFIANSFEKGSGITKEDIVIDGDTSCVRYGEIYTKYNIKFSECKTKTNVESITNPQYFSYGDVLFTCTGELVEEIGKSIVYLGKEKCLAGGDIVVMRHEQNPLFMGFALDSWYAQEQKSRGKTKLKVVHTSASALGNIYILLPSKKEQEEIGKYLDSKCSYIERLISLKEQKIKKLNAYKKSLIYEYVTGKKQVSSCEFSKESSGKKEV